MRIAIVLPDLAGGGAERAVLRLVDGLLDRGHLIDLVLLRPTGRYRKIVPPGIRLFHTKYPFRRVPGARAFLADPLPPSETLPVSPWKRYRAHRTLRKRWPGGRITSRNGLDGAAVAAYLRRGRPDVLFAARHPANVAAVCGKALAGAGLPVVISLRNNLALDYPRDDLARARVLYCEADAAVAVSRGVAGGGAGTLGIPVERIVPIPNPVPVEAIATAARAPVEHPWFAEGEPPVVLAAGRPMPQKDHVTLVRALARLHRSTEARLAILCSLNHHGHPAAIEETRALAASLGVAEHIAHIDFDENPFRYMARAAVLALSSRWEGFPNVLLEAMACGTPVASTDAPYGPAEILEDGRWGPLVSVGDADALADAFAGILAGRRVSAEDLRARAAAFATEKAVDAYENLFTSLLRKSPRAAPVA